MSLIEVQTGSYLAEDEIAGGVKQLDTGLPAAFEHFLAYAAVGGLSTLAFRNRVPSWLLSAALISYAALLELASFGLRAGRRT